MNVEHDVCKKCGGKIKIITIDYPGAPDDRPALLCPYCKSIYRDAMKNVYFEQEIYKDE